MLTRLPGRSLAIGSVLVLLVAGFILFHGGSDTRRVTAYFDRTVSIYKGSDLRVMGVRIGTVTAVVPEGDRVRVAMEYDAKYKLPTDAKAAIITPTLTADRFVQIAPAYDGGAALPDGARIELPDTGTPVELDRIYQSLSDLTQALGPSGANKDGSLDRLLGAGAKALQGNGQLGNQTLLNLSAAVSTFADNRGPLFDSVQNMSRLTTTLAANDRFVSRFMGDLAAVSSELSGERGNLRGALAALARAMGIVRSFVHDNKHMVQKDVRELTDILGVLAKRKDELDTAAHLSALGLGNLGIGWDTKSRSEGARVQFGPQFSQLDDVLCVAVQNSGRFSRQQAQTTCQLLSLILGPFNKQMGNNPFDPHSYQLKLGGSQPPQTLTGLLGSLKEGNR